MLESTAYYQRNRNMDDYLDEFRNLVLDSGYTDAKVIVVKFCRGLQASIQNTITTMVSGCPSDIDYEGWYAAARQVDQARATNEAFQASGRADPTPKPKAPAPRPLRPSILPSPWTLTPLARLAHYPKYATGVINPVTSRRTVLAGMMSGA